MTPFDLFLYLAAFGAGLLVILLCGTIGLAWIGWVIVARRDRS